MEILATLRAGKSETNRLNYSFQNVAKLMTRGGQQEGCNDVDDSFSNHRRYFHQGVMWGFRCVSLPHASQLYDYYLELEAPTDTFRYLYSWAPSAESEWSSGALVFG